VERIEAVSLSDVRRAAGEHLRPDGVSIVVVGDAEKVREGLEALDVGPVVPIPAGELLE
jgi:predicted Zn-dependent peptidase